MTTPTPSPTFTFPSRDTILRRDILGFGWAGIGFLVYGALLGMLGYLTIVSDSIVARVGGGILVLSSLACLIIAIRLFREMIICRAEIKSYLKQHPTNGIRPESIRFSLSSLLFTGITGCLAIYGITWLAQPNGHIYLNVVIIACLNLILIACVMVATNPLTALRDRVLLLK